MLLSDAEAIVRRHQWEIPVNVVSLARDLGATVYFVPDWPDETAGMIRKDRKYGGSRGYIIYVNAAHPPNRKRFTIAHEIAHIMLHEHLIGDGITTDGMYRSGLDSTVEWSANRMAANILMPWPWIERLFAEGVTDVTAMASRFGVSRDAMAIRLDLHWRLQHWDDPVYEK